MIDKPVKKVKEGKKITLVEVIKKDISIKKVIENRTSNII